MPLTVHAENNESTSSAGLTPSRLSRRLLRHAATLTLTSLRCHVPVVLGRSGRSAARSARRPHAAYGGAGRRSTFGAQFGSKLARHPLDGVRETVVARVQAIDEPQIETVQQGRPHRRLDVASVALRLGGDVGDDRLQGGRHVEALERLRYDGSVDFASLPGRKIVVRHNLDNAADINGNITQNK